MKDETAPDVDQQRLVLPAVAGRMQCSNAEFERRCLISIADEQDKLMPDNSLVALLCDGVRMAREYSAAMNGQNVAGEATASKKGTTP